MIRNLTCSFRIESSQKNQKTWNKKIKISYHQKQFYLVYLLFQLVYLAFEHENTPFVKSARLIGLLVYEVSENIIFFFEYLVACYNVLNIFQQIRATMRRFFSIAYWICFVSIRCWIYSRCCTRCYGRCSFYMII